MKVANFVNEELKQFSNYDNVRSIPNLMDGQKVCQRKVLYGALRNGKNMLQVARLGMKAAEMTNFHHGESSIIDATTRMAQSFPGSNNLPLLLGDGQFGNRLSNKASEARYIMACIHPTNFNRVFHEEDLDIVTPLIDQGMVVEPECYYPIIPLLLVNGALGIGTGYYANIPCHKVEDVTRAVMEVINTGAVQTPLVPYYEGYTGTITRSKEGQITVSGNLEIVDSTTIRITEIPPNWEQDKYKKTVLNPLLDVKIGNSAWLKDYTNMSTENGWLFELSVPRAVTNMGRSKLMQALKIEWKFTPTYVAWSDANTITTYDSPEEMVEDFVARRMIIYSKRKNNIIAKTTEKMRVLDIKIQFIHWWRSNQNTLINMSRKDIIHQVMSTDWGSGCTQDDIDTLLGMKIYNLTLDEVDKMESTMQDMKRYVDEITQTRIMTMWENDLQRI